MKTDEVKPEATEAKTPSATAKTSREVSSWPRVGALALIRFYQTRISPLTPPACRFHPTCSHYTGEAIERFGLARGALLGAARICKCHPLHPGGLDLVPEEFPWRVRSKSTVLPSPDGSSFDSSSHDRKKS